MKAEGFISEMLLDGDSAALESFLCSNKIQAGVKHDALFLALPYNWRINSISISLLHPA